jgi:hypothetical protein
MVDVWLENLIRSDTERHARLNKLCHVDLSEFLTAEAESLRVARIRCWRVLGILLCE